MDEMEYDNRAADNAAEDTPEVETDAVEMQDGEQKPQMPGMHMELYEWVQSVVSTLIVVLLIFVFVGRQISVDGVSMMSTLHPGDYVLTSNVFYEPDNGDIIIVKVESEDSAPYVKRVIATAGQTIDINLARHEVIVDGVVIDEPYINEMMNESRPMDFVGPQVVPNGCIFVMGDNRNHSTDSRSASVGFIDERNVIGKVHMILMPGKDGMEERRDWSRFGSVYGVL